MNNRPRSVTVISWLIIAACTLGIAYHLIEFKARGPIDYGIVWVCFIRLLGIFCGMFMLRASNWARWLLLVWIAYHAILSAFHSPAELIMHSLLLIVVAYFLFLPRASAYFRRSKAEPA